MRATDYTGAEHAGTDAGEVQRDEQQQQQQQHVAGSDGFALLGQQLREDGGDDEVAGKEGRRGVALVRQTLLHTEVR